MRNQQGRIDVATNTCRVRNDFRNDVRNDIPSLDNKDVSAECSLAPRQLPVADTTSQAMWSRKFRALTAESAELFALDSLHKALKTEVLRHRCRPTQLEAYQMTTRTGRSRPFHPAGIALGTAA